VVRVFVTFRFQELVDLWIGKGGIGAEVAAKVALPVAGHDRFEQAPPAFCRVNVARMQRTPLQIAELVERE
jgi:hypothetical protein